MSGYGFVPLAGFSASFFTSEATEKKGGPIPWVSMSVFFFISTLANKRGTKR